MYANNLDKKQGLQIDSRYEIELNMSLYFEPTFTQEVDCKFQILYHRVICVTN